MIRKNSKDHSKRGSGVVSFNFFNKNIISGVELVLVEPRRVRWDFVEEKEEKRKRGKGSIKRDKKGQLQIVKENADEERILGHMENQPLMSIGGCVMNNVFIKIRDMLYKGKYYLSSSSNIDFLFLYYTVLNFNAVLYFPNKTPVYFKRQN